MCIRVSSLKGPQLHTRAIRHAWEQSEWLNTSPAPNEHTFGHAYTGDDVHVVKVRDSRRRPQSASVSQLQEPSVVAATFKGRRKKPDASPLFQPLSASSTGVRRSKRLKKEDKKMKSPKNKKQE
uniref:Uncharacterized protein n=1 Tax=Trichuris muris TaxID=70415 RepID=A0A5S6QWF4_TRIMR